MTSKTPAIAALLLALAMLNVAHAVDGDTELGAELYGEFCANCHGANAAGLSTFNDDLDMFNERLEGITENMPDFAGVFEEEEIAALYAFLEQATAE